MVSFKRFLHFPAIPKFLLEESCHRIPQNYFMGEKHENDTLEWDIFGQPNSKPYFPVVALNILQLHKPLRAIFMGKRDEDGVLTFVCPTLCIVCQNKRVQQCRKSDWVKIPANYVMFVHFLVSSIKGVAYASSLKIVIMTFKQIRSGI